jgi:hypothetical protein
MVKFLLCVFISQQCSVLASFSLMVHLGAWSPDSSRLRFFRAPMVSVLIAEVITTLASWLYWMVSSYAGRLGTKMAFLRLACLNT